MDGHLSNQLKNIFLLVKISCQDVLDCTFVGRRQCKYLKNVDKIETFGYGIVCDVRRFLFVKCMY